MVNSFVPPPPFQPAPPGGMMAQQTLNPVALLDALKQLVPQAELPGPRYPANYVKPPKPDPKRIKQQADELYRQGDLWRNLLEITAAWIRLEKTGIFEEDLEDRRHGLQEEFISPMMRRKRDAFITRIASTKVGVRKNVYADELRRKAQYVEDAAVWLMKELEWQHAAGGNRPMRLDEAEMFTDRGMYCSRQVLDPSDPDMPIILSLIEPMQVYPVWMGKRGLHQVYRVYRDSIANITAEYGDFHPEARAKLEKKFGRDLTDRMEIPVYEYWDTWYRAVCVDDVEIVPVTAHEYGYVPWTIQYGGLGESMFSRVDGDQSSYQGTNGEFYQLDKSRQGERAYKAVPLLYVDRFSHSIFEAVMARLITGFKREINPPIIRYRSIMAAGTDMPEFSAAAGAVNEAMLGEEQIQPVPNMSNNPITGMIQQTLLTDLMSSNPSMQGALDKTNQATGSALTRVGEEGQEMLVPFYQAYETAKAHQLSQILQTIGNFGHLAKYAGDTPRPTMVPARRKRQGEAPAFELSRDLIDAVGPKVEVTLTKVSPADWVPLFNAGKIGVEAGFILPDTIYELATGNSDYDSFLEEWTERQAWFNAITHPKFNELFNIPAMIAEQIKESDGDPDMVQFWTQRLQEWLQMAQQQAMQQGPPGMGGGDPMAALQGMGQPAQQQVPPGALPPPPGSTVVAPPTTSGVSLPSMGMGPGSQGGAVGRPGGF